MNIIQKRTAVKNAYPGESWAKKVDAMDDGKVTAVFLRLKSQNKV